MSNLPWWDHALFSIWPIKIHANTTAHGVPIAIPRIWMYNLLLNLVMLLSRTQRVSRIISCRVCLSLPLFFRASSKASKPLFRDRGSLRLPLVVCTSGNDSIMGFRIMSKYIETTYVTHPILAQIGRSGGDFPRYKWRWTWIWIRQLLEFWEKIGATGLYLINV